MTDRLALLHRFFSEPDGFALDMLQDPVVGQNPLVVAWLKASLYGDCSLPVAVNGIIRDLCKQNRELLDLNVKLTARQPATFVLRPNSDNGPPF